MQVEHRAAQLLHWGVVVVVIGAVAGIASADPVKCQRGINKASAAFAAARLKLLAKCEEAKHKGKLPPATDCMTDPKTAASLAKAETELRSVLDGKCGGADKTCGAGGDDDSLSGISWPSVCPEFEALGCSNAIGSCADIADCLVCIDGRAVDQAVALYYDSLAPAGSGTSLAKCQLAIGKLTAKFYAAKTKAIAKCWDARLTGKHGDFCPDAAVPAGSPAAKAAATIAAAEAKKVAGICKACGGADSRCDDVGDFTPDVIGFPASCPAVASCGGAVGALSQLVDCVDCVSEFKVDCATSLAVPAVAPYPESCPAAVPTSNATGTPLPSATTSPVPTQTATPTPSAPMTPTRTATPALTPATATPTSTRTATATLTATVVVTPTVNATATPTSTGTATPAGTPTRSATPTISRTPTPTRSATPTRTRTATPTVSPTVTPVPGGRCGDGVLNIGEDCDDGNTDDCDSCPTSCHRAPVGCPTAGRFAQQLHIAAPVGSEFSGGVFCLTYPTNVSLPGSGSVGGRVTGLSGGLPVLNDFNNAAQLSFVANPSAQEFNPTISFDLCQGQPTPPTTSFVCVVKQAEDQGIEIDPTTIQCQPAPTPTP